MGNEILPIHWYIFYHCVAAFVVYSQYEEDKRRAMAGEWRISNVDLEWGMIFSPIGGALGMYYNRHKIRYWSYWFIFLCSAYAHYNIGVALCIDSLNHGVD